MNDQLPTHPSPQEPVKPSPGRVESDPATGPVDTDAFNRRAAFFVLVGIVLIPAAFGIVIGILALLHKL